MKLWECTPVSCLLAQLRGPFVGYFYWPTSVTHTLSLCQSPNLTGKHHHQMYVVCLCKHTYSFTPIDPSASLAHTESAINFKCSTFTSKYQNRYSIYKYHHITCSINLLMHEYFKLNTYTHMNANSIAVIHSLLRNQWSEDESLCFMGRPIIILPGPSVEYFTTLKYCNAQFSAKNSAVCHHCVTVKVNVTVELCFDEVCARPVVTSHPWTISSCVVLLTNPQPQGFMDQLPWGRMWRKWV